MQRMEFDINALIEAAGGAGELARRMGFTKETGRLRVAQWKSRQAIPPMVRQAYRAFFKRLLARHARRKVQETT